MHYNYCRVHSTLRVTPAISFEGAPRLKGKSNGKDKSGFYSIPWRALNVAQLRELDKTLVIQDNDKPLAVLLKCEHFLAMQEQILKNE